MYNSNTARLRKGEIVHCHKVLICEVPYYLKANCDKLKIYTINPNATTKMAK